MTDPTVDLIHYTPPCTAPTGSTMCWKKADPERIIPVHKGDATCPECLRTWKLLGKATTGRGVLKKGYKGCQ